MNTIITFGIIALIILAVIIVVAAYFYQRSTREVSLPQRFKLI